MFVTSRYEEGMNLRNILIFLWGSTLFIYARKIANTFRPAVWFAKQFYDIDKTISNNAALWENEGQYQSDYYSTLGENEQKFIDYVIDNSDKSDSVLDVCCNQGRFLFDLQSKGYSSLYGFDIMGEAIDKLKNKPEYQPETIHVEHVLAQNYFDDKEDNSFDWAITYTATIELINPEFDIFSELSRTVKKGMFLVINENGHSYPRFYRLLHRINGFRVVSVVSFSSEIVLIHSVKR